MKNHFLILAIVGVFTCSTASADNVEQIQKMVVKAETFCGQFNQQRYLSGIKRTINSSGRFCVDSRKGILWRTQNPYKSTMKITGNEIVQYSGDRLVSRMSAQKQPAVKVLHNILFSLSSGDLSPLQHYFTVNTTVNQSYWHATLIGKNSSAGMVMKRIDVEGDKYVRHLVMEEKNGDRMNIFFSEFSTGHGALMPEDRAFYE